MSEIQQDLSQGPRQPLLPGFDLDALRLPQNFGESLGVKRLLTRVPVRRPLKTEFFRVRSGESWRLQTMILEIKEEGETYLLLPAVWDAVPELLRPAVLHTAIDRRENVFLIPVPLPGPDGRRNPWHQSLNSAVTKAETNWVRSVANMKQGGYDLYVADGNIPDPEWPDVTFQELVKTAFRERVIDTIAHPVIQQLLGAS
jgi:hypothetical protein